MKKLLLIATGGTIASKYTEEGLTPKVPARELLSFVPEYRQLRETTPWLICRPKKAKKTGLSVRTGV